MTRFGRYFCPRCGKVHGGGGRLGSAMQCGCGARIPSAHLDRVRYYWILQIALTYGAAAFLFALAVFSRTLPSDRWERFFSPLLQSPAISAFIVSGLFLIRHKSGRDGDDLMFRYFLWGVSLMILAIMLALLVATMP